MSTVSTGMPVARTRPLLGWHIRDGFVVAKRNLLQTIRVPELLFFSLVQPVIFVLMFAYVFGGAIPIPGATGGAEAYRQFLIPGIFGQTVAFAAASSTVGIAEDMSKGIIDRFRSLPMRASAVLFGRTFADAARMILVLAVLSITGLIVGWRINNGALDAIAAYLLLLFAYTVAWVGAWIGLYMPNPETANTAGLIWLFPLTFISNAFVPLQTMPGILQAVAAWNPLSALVLSCRNLFGNDNGQTQGTDQYWSLEHPEAWTILSCAIVLAIFVPLAVRRYRRANYR